MDGAADIGPEHRVDTAMLLDAAQPGELRRDNFGAEVVPAAGEVDYMGAGPGKRGLDALLELIRGGHLTQRVAVATLREVLAGRPPQEYDT